MGVHRGDAGRPLEVQGVAISPRRHLHPGNAAIGGRHHHESLTSLRLEIETCVKVVAPQLPKVSTQTWDNVQGIGPSMFLFELIGTGVLLRHQSSCSS